MTAYWVQLEKLPSHEESLTTCKMGPVEWTAVCSVLSLPLRPQRPHLYQYSDTLELVTTTAIPYFRDRNAPARSLQCIQFIPIIILEHPFITDVSPSLDNHKDIVNESGFIVSRASALHWTAPVEKSIIFLPPMTTGVKINENFRKFQLKSFMSPPFNLNPQRVIRIFIGNKASLEFVLQLEYIQALHFKVGILDGKPRAGQGVITEAHRLATFTTVDQFSAFSMFKDQHLHAQVYPSNIH